MIHRLSQHRTIDLEPGRQPGAVGIDGPRNVDDSDPIAGDWFESPTRFRLRFFQLPAEMLYRCAGFGPPAGSSPRDAVTTDVSANKSIIAAASTATSHRNLEYSRPIFCFSRPYGVRRMALANLKMRNRFGH
jgi:hypothetical protein